MLKITKKEAAFLREKFGGKVYITKPTKTGKVYVAELAMVKRALAEYNGEVVPTGRKTSRRKGKTT